MEEIRLNAHAKLNLSLEIVGKRPDGYHNIVSLMQGIGLHDRLEIKKCAENGTKYNLSHCTIEGLVVYLCTDEKTIPTDMNNLAFKGIAAVLQNIKNKSEAASEIKDEIPGLIINLEKRLPVAAGIAGGSGNAAAAMLGLNALMGYPFSLRELMDMGAGVGADVPFSLFMNAYRNKEVLSGLREVEETSDAAWTSGIGDIVEAADPIPYHVILANPGIAVSTRDAYVAIDSIGYEEGGNGKRELFINDLEKYTLENYPEALGLKQLMEDKLSADEIIMSGSGPSIAAYYRDRDKAISDAELMNDISRHKGFRSWLTSTGIIKEEASQI